jgi:hypothetical protein
MEKYYTPNIEEFYVGFEYEISNPGGTDFNKETVHSSRNLIDILHYMDYYEHGAEDVRVKYLDREDIEECGWESLGSGWYSTEFDSRRLRVWKDHEIIIHRWYSDEDNEKIFQGKINNKSELKRIMKQIGI